METFEIISEEDVTSTLKNNNFMSACVQFDKRKLKVNCASDAIYYKNIMTHPL